MEWWRLEVGVVVVGGCGWQARTQGFFMGNPPLKLMIFIEEFSIDNIYIMH